MPLHAERSSGKATILAASILERNHSTTGRRLAASKLVLDCGTSFPASRLPIRQVHVKVSVKCPPICGRVLTQSLLEWPAPIKNIRPSILFWKRLTGRKGSAEGLQKLRVAPTLMRRFATGFPTWAEKGPPAREMDWPKRGEPRTLMGGARLTLFSALRTEMLRVSA